MRKSETLVIDTIRLADEFRVDPVDAAGVVVDGPVGDTADVSIVFEQDTFSATVIDDAEHAIRRHVDGGSPSGDPPEIVTRPDPSSPPEKFEEIVIEWD